MTATELAEMREPMSPDTAAYVRSLFTGCDFYVDEDPDDEEFFSVFSYLNGSGCEIAGKIGERSVAVAIADMMSKLCGPPTSLPK